jgi:hypothetical protein
VRREITAAASVPRPLRAALFNAVGVMLVVVGALPELAAPEEEEAVEDVELDDEDVRRRLKTRRRKNDVMSS